MTIQKHHIQTKKLENGNTNRGLANIEWNKFVFPPKSKQVQRKAKGYSNVM